MSNGNIYQNKKPTALVESKFYAVIAFIIILCIIISKYAFKDNEMTCDNYIFNSYLYLLLSVIIIFSIVIFNEHTYFYSPVIRAFKHGNVLVPFSIIVMQLILIGLFKYKLKTEDHKNILNIHVYWILLNIVIALFIIPIMYFANIKHVTNPLIIIALLWSAIMVIKNILSNNGNEINWSYYLVITLIIYMISMIILPVISYFFSNGTDYLSIANSILKIESIIVIVLLLLINHIAITDNSKKCVENNILPNYPEESFDFFMLIKNLLSDFFNLIGLCSYEYRKYK
jgi:hypothetical protein